MSEQNPLIGQVVVSDICVKCKVRPATENWGEGVIAFVHGIYERRCRRCCAEEQLEHARKMAEAIPILEAEIASLP